MQNTNTPAPRVRATKKRRRKTKRWLVWMIALLVIVAIAIAGTVCYCQYKNALHEEQEFAILGGNNFQVADYEEFLKKYPDSKHTAEVKARLAQLRTMHATWANIHDCNSLQTFRQFVRQYPFQTCEYYLICQHKIDSLEWLEAKRQGTSEALRHYCQMHGQGDYVIDAELLLDSIEKEKQMLEQYLIDSAITADVETNL